MKFNLIVLGLVSIFAVSCNSSSEPATKNADTVKPQVCKYVYDSQSTVVGWEAFKTNAKKGVKGVFNKVDVLVPNSSENMLQTLSGATFSIPVNSINSENEARDLKLQNSFFGNMTSSEIITGLVKSIDETTATVEITMNGVSHDYTGNLKVEDKTVNFNVGIDLLDFEAKTAMDSLNVVCGELHKGDDGVTKLWSEVDITVTTTLVQECK